MNRHNFLSFLIGIAVSTTLSLKEDKFIMPKRGELEIIHIKSRKTVGFAVLNNRRILLETL